MPKRSCGGWGSNAIDVRQYDAHGFPLALTAWNWLSSQSGLRQRNERAASGVYIYALEFGNFKKTRTMTLLK